MPPTFTAFFWILPRDFEFHQQGDQRSGCRAAQCALAAGGTQQAAEQPLRIAFDLLAETGEEGIKGHGAGR